MIETRVVKVSWLGTPLRYEECQQATLAEARAWLELKVVLTGDTGSIYVDGVLVETWNIIEGRLDKWVLPYRSAA